jgi:CRP-like cAMP-binding protein
MVKSGEVEIFTQNPRGKKTVLATLKSGNIFGEIGPLLDRPRMAAARTTQPSELLQLTKEDLEACLQKFPILRSTLKEISSQRLTRMVEILSLEKVEKIKEGMV